MPFTPFHFGPGVLVKACLPQQFWLTSFMAANVLVDLEVLYYLRQNEPPLHRHWHTYLGGSVAGITAGVLMFATAWVAVAFLPASWQALKRLRSTRRVRLLSESLLSGLVGGISHIVLDSFMHHDMHPFWPLWDGNNLAGMIGVGALHGALAVSGVFGVLLWCLLSARR